MPFEQDRRGGRTCRWIACAALAGALGGPAPAWAADADATPPRGAVGGVTNPAAGTLQLHVRASDDGVGLGYASAYLDDRLAAEARFADPTCSEPGGRCPATGEAALPVSTAGVPDGAHLLRVEARDAAGNAATLVDTAITVANTPPHRPSTVTLSIGGGAGEPVAAPPAGGTGGERARCRAPRLTVSLAQRPLRFRRGVPVLVSGRRYRYRGRLTCRIGGRQRAAPRGTRIAVRKVVGRRVVERTVRVRGRGGIVVRLAARSSRAIVFRVRAAGGRLVRARIRVRVVRRARAAQDPGTDVGGTVPSYLALALEEPSGFASFPAGAGVHELAIRARVTSTEPRARLSIADGDLASGPRLGRLASGRSVLESPLEARVGSRAFQPLDAATDPLLASWRPPVANQRATVQLRQRIEPGERPRGSYRKTLLITVSPDVP